MMKRLLQREERLKALFAMRTELLLASSGKSIIVLTR